MGDGRSAHAGVVTFVFTDVESSTRLWAADPAAMSASLQVHDRIVPKDHLGRRSVATARSGRDFSAGRSLPQRCALGVVTVSVIDGWFGVVGVFG